MARKNALKLGSARTFWPILKHRLSRCDRFQVDKERLQVALWATGGQYTPGRIGFSWLDEFSWSTIQIWLDCFVADGVERD